MSSMSSIQEVRKELSLVFSGLKDGTLNRPDVTELNNTAGKIINTLKVELEYYALLKEKPDIPFFKAKK